MSSNRQIVADAFAAWSAGTGYVTNVFAPDMRWEIVGRSAVSRRYDSTQQFVDEVLHPFGARFSAEAPFRPVNIRAIHADDEQRTVAVVWDGEGTTIAGTTYRNTYAWFMTLEDGKVINGTAFYDSIAFHELGDRQTRQIAGTGGAGARIVVGLVQGRRPADEVQSSPGVVPNAEHGFAMPGRSGWPAGVRGGGPRRVAQLGDAGTAHG